MKLSLILMLFMILLMASSCMSIDEDVMNANKYEWKCFEKYCYKCMRRLKKVSDKETLVE